MSRIGLKPVVLPSGVNVNVNEDTLTVKGAKGELSVVLPDCVSVEVKDGALHVSRKDESPRSRTLHGTTRANIHNAVVGVSEGFQKKLVITGTGYRAAMRGTALVLNVGFSHEVVIEPLPGVSISVEKDVNITVEGADKQKVGQTAALIHDTKRPEP